MARPAKLDRPDIEAKLGAVPGWAVADNALTRQLKFNTFPDAIAFVTRLAFAAEAADHHPDLLVSYRKVKVTWSTHDAGGITEKDFAGVTQTDLIAARFGV